MDDSIKNFIDSGILEEYLLGLTDDDQNKQVESMLASSIDVREAYNRLEETIEHYAKSHAKRPPESLRSSILKNIKTNKPAEDVPIKKKSYVKYILGLAAGVLLFISINQWMQIDKVRNELASTQKSLNELILDCDLKTEKLEAYKKQIRIINDPQTQRVVLIGNELAPEFRSLAYWNKESRESYIQITSLPPLQNNRCYQMWADVDDVMISLGVLKNQEKDVLVSIPFMANATSLNITIEPEGGSDHPTLSRVLASQPIL